MKYNINNRLILNQSLKLKKIKEIKDEKLCNNIVENKANKIDKKFYFKNIILKKYIIFFILIDLFIKILTSNKPLLFVLNYSTIKLKIIGKGHKHILGSNFLISNYPNEVYINEIKAKSVTYIYDFNQTDNSVELVWNYYISNCHNMFYYCTNITEIDLSNFETSRVTNMWSMFEGCSLLTSLNLSHFDTSQVTDMEYMFSGCKNLEYINLKNFNDTKLNNGSSYYQGMFDLLPDNIIICVEENNLRSKILPQIRNKNCYTLDCSDDWKTKQKKINYVNNQCVNNCEENTPYIYEYNGKCYENCPKGFLTDNNNITKKCKCILDNV